MNTSDNQGIKFSKYHGAGNDFIMINAYNDDIILSKEQIIAMCDRHTGIGANGLIILSRSENHDFKMDYYNSDGSGNTFCGNGGRCVMAFAFQEGIVDKKAEYEASDGVHLAEIKEIHDNECIISLSMRDVESYDLTENRLLINTGSPHYVKRVVNINDINVQEEGKKIRYDKSISGDGVNVDYMSYDNGHYIIRTYERGVEDETLACGTGVTASAIAASLWYGGNEIDIVTRIARLNVKFNKEGNKFKNILLTGPTMHVFDGIYIFANKN